MSIHTQLESHDRLRQSERAHVVHTVISSLFRVFEEEEEEEEGEGEEPSLNTECQPASKSSSVARVGKVSRSE